EQGVPDVEQPGMEKANGAGDEEAEQRRGIFGLGEPVVGEMAVAGQGEAMEEILVLVRVVERRLGIRQGEEERGAKEEGDGRPTLDGGMKEAHGEARSRG